MNISKQILSLTGNIEIWFKKCFKKDFNHRKIFGAY